MSQIDNNKNGGTKRKTMTDRIIELENIINKLINIIDERKQYENISHLHCKREVNKNEKLNFIVDAYNNSYMRIIDDKIRQMQQLSYLYGYLTKMIDDGNFSTDEIRRAQYKQNEILSNLNNTRSSLEQIEAIMALQVSNI
jgi:hypothetical protein